MTDAELPSQLSLDDALAENPFAMEKPSDQEKFKSAFGVDTNESEDAKDDSKNDEKTEKQSGTENKKDVRAKKFGSARMDEEPNLKERSSRDLGSSRRQRSQVGIEITGAEVGHGRGRHPEDRGRTDADQETEVEDQGPETEPEIMTDLVLGDRLTVKNPCLQKEKNSLKLRIKTLKK